jgi:transposase
MTDESTKVMSEVEHQAVTLARQGMSARAIARALHIGRNRVRRILREHGQARTEPHSALDNKRSHATKRPSKLDPFTPTITQLLERYPDITAQRVLEDLRAAGYEGGYSIVKTRVQEMRPPPAPKISRPTPTYGPGKMSESDWSPYKITFLSGVVQEVQAFGYALPYSRRKCFSFHQSNDLHALMDGHVQAFERLGGAAEVTKFDSQKPVVLRWEGNQPIYNPRFIDFATHYEFSPHACTRASPNEKPRVERSFWELERSFLNGRSFVDLRDLNAQLVVWLDTVCDVRPPKAGQRAILEAFTQEQPHLRPLPRHHYDTARVAYRVCDLEGCIVYQTNRYEVPYDHVTDILPVRITATAIHIYASDLRESAVHELRRKGAGERVELPGRKVPARRRVDNERLEATFASLGDEAPSFFAGLQQAQPRSTAYHARKIIALRERYSTTDIYRALTHALRYSAFDFRSIERILLTRADPRRLDEYVAEVTREKIEAAWGHSRTEPRALSEYDDLPCHRTRPPSQRGDDPCHHHDEAQPARTANEAPSKMPPASSCANTSETLASSTSTTTSSIASSSVRSTKSPPTPPSSSGSSDTRLEPDSSDGSSDGSKPPG